MSTGKITNRWKLGVAATVLALATPTGWATTYTYVGTGKVTVSQVTIYQAPSGTGALVMISPPNPTTLNQCGYTTGDYVWIDFSTTGATSGRDLYATILAAATAGNMVAIGVYGCGAGSGGTPGNGVPLAYGVTVYTQ